MEFHNPHDLDPQDLTEAAAIIVHHAGPYKTGWELAGFVTGHDRLGEATKFAVLEDRNLAGLPIVTKRIQRSDLERAERSDPPPDTPAPEIVVEALPRDPDPEPEPDTPAAAEPA